MGKRYGVDIRRARGGKKYASRVRRGNRPRVPELSSEDGRAVRRTGRQPAAATAHSEVPRLRWRVRREHGDVLAIEPGGEYEHVFDGGDDPFGAALNFAAAELRKVMSDE